MRQPKVMISACIDYDTILEVRAKGLKVSPLINKLLKAHLDIAEDEAEDEYTDDMKETDVRIAQLMGQLEELRKGRKKMKKEERDKEKKQKEEDEKGWVTQRISD